MTVDTRLMTAEELLAIPDDGCRYELVRGELIKMSPSGHVHGRIAARMMRSLSNYVSAKALGETYVAEAGYILSRNPDTVRAPDVSFVTKERDRDDEGYFLGAPDLAVEVISPSDTYSEVNAKVGEYLAAGTRIVILIDPRKVSAAVHRPGAATVHVAIDDAIDGADVVPGWSLPLRELFG
jgi:Uma2 family endonuclease